MSRLRFTTPAQKKASAWQSKAFYLSILAIALASCAASPLDPPAPSGALTGRARMEGVFTDHSSIRLRLQGLGQKHETRTDGKGNFAFRDIPPGSYALTVERDRYFPVTLPSVTVAAGSTVAPVTLRNHRELVALSGVYDAAQGEEAEEPEFGGMIPTRSPFLTNLALSPDGKRLGFIQAGEVRSVRLDGTELRTEKALPAGTRADWVDWGERGFLTRSWHASGSAASASGSVTLLTPGGARTLVPAGNDAVFAPVFSPDEQQVAYVRYVPSSKSPQLMRISANGGSPVTLIDLLDRLNLRGIWDGTYGLMFAPLEWRPEGLMFHAPMTCNLERAGFTSGKDGIYTLRDVNAPQAPDALHKAHFYSYYAHAFSHDGKRMLYAYGPQIRSKDLEDLVVTAPGSNVGNHSDEVLESLTPSPDGERLFYLTPTGIEEMNLLGVSASP